MTIATAEAHRVSERSLADHLGGLALWARWTDDPGEVPALTDGLRAALERLIAVVGPARFLAMTTPLFERLVLLDARAVLGRSGSSVARPRTPEEQARRLAERLLAGLAALGETRPPREFGVLLADLIQRYADVLGLE